ncbi:hypothetical protein [Bombilactobacillus thymidiniphilus]|uniref:Uncharacterized protein n=1 Tax=Bombilactobacillus thymidiniphilus TaxID=2923363 RepID=A0ABY4PD93_9LACO|nr:hypothetical protein [Bombilactobacillus thymidiniphilus]UQS83743.1 hypothetical protein MOO47_00640 [Bombilactobacillus thymidiniphilus]
MKIISGWKQLCNYQPHFDQFIQDYALIKGNLNLHFVWPKHRLSPMNNYRYSNYNDRIDYLLFDLKCYFEGLETPMMKACQKETTFIWLQQFKNNFAYFVDKMQLQ